MTLVETVADGRLRYADQVRRQTYPDNADPDAVAIAEHYRMRYSFARIIKALSYGVPVTPDEMSYVSGIDREFLTRSVIDATERCGVSPVTVMRYNRVVRWQLDDTYACAALRKVIRSGWQL